MSVHLITGDDESLLLSASTELIHRLVGDGDRSLMVDDFDGPDYEVRGVVDAAQTAPFLTDTRIVVARGVGRFLAADVASLVAYLADPLPSTELVLVAGGGRLAKSLTEAVAAAGGVTIGTSPGSRPKDRTEWLTAQVADVGLKIDRAAMDLMANWLAEDVARVGGVLDTLRSTYGTGTTLRSDDVLPFLGEAGGVPPWDLTDSIDQGRTSRALQLLHRMISAGDRHPLALMAILHSHYARLLVLAGAATRDEASAAAAMGIKPGFPARKAFEQFRVLGGDGVRRAVRLLAQADLDLRGAKDWPDELVMEVLVARLSRLAPARR